MRSFISTWIIRKTMGETKKGRIVFYVLFSLRGEKGNKFIRRSRVSPLWNLL